MYMLTLINNLPKNSLLYVESLWHENITWEEEEEHLLGNQVLQLVIAPIFVKKRKEE